jgi:hypothetical protein
MQQIPPVKAIVTLAHRHSNLVLTLLGRHIPCQEEAGRAPVVVAGHRSTGPFSEGRLDALIGVVHALYPRQQTSDRIVPRALVFKAHVLKHYSQESHHSDMNSATMAERRNPKKPDSKFRV